MTEKSLQDEPIKLVLISYLIFQRLSLSKALHNLSFVSVRFCESLILQRDASERGMKKSKIMFELLDQRILEPTCPVATDKGNHSFK